MYYQPYPYQPLDQLNQMKAQQYQQALPQPQMIPTQMSGTYQNQNVINGRIVTSVDVINPNEVPMDGSMAIFQKDDRSEIYGKSYNSDGTIKTVIYKPVEQEKEITKQIEYLLSDKDASALMERFDDVIERITAIEKYVKPKTPTRTKKGDVSE